ncbi:MAG: Tim44/TimA family putative adaptor protein [Pseudomonadota bacterium]
MPADILLYAIIAAGLIFWLRSILGSVDDDEADSMQNRPGMDDEGFMARKNKDGGENVVRLRELSGVRDDLPPHAKFDNKTAENTLEDILREKEDFDLGYFIDGAEHAFIMIIEAFAEGDKETLEDLLAPPVYKAFSSVIDERQIADQTVETKVQSVDRIDIVEAKMTDEVFFITLRFHAKEICVIRNKNGEIISGDPDKVTEMVDVWVFGQPLDAEGPEWYLYETRDDQEEDHKTPIPEAGDTK